MQVSLETTIGTITRRDARRDRVRSSRLARLKNSRGKRACIDSGQCMAASVPVDSDVSPLSAIDARIVRPGAMRSYVFYIECVQCNGAKEGEGRHRHVADPKGIVKSRNPYEPYGSRTEPTEPYACAVPPCGGHSKPQRRRATRRGTPPTLASRTKCTRESARLFFF